MEIFLMTTTIDHKSNDIKIAHFSLTDFAKTHCSKLPFRLVTKANLYRIILCGQRIPTC